MTYSLVKCHEDKYLLLLPIYYFIASEKLPVFSLFRLCDDCHQHHTIQSWSMHYNCFHFRSAKLCKMRYSYSNFTLCLKNAPLFCQL